MTRENKQEEIIKIVLDPVESRHSKQKPVLRTGFKFEHELYSGHSHQPLSA